MSKRSRSPSGSDLEDDVAPPPCIPAALFADAPGGAATDAPDLAVARTHAAGLGPVASHPLEQIICAGMLPPTFWTGGAEYRESAQVLKDLLMLPPYWAGASFDLTWPRMLEVSWEQLGMPADELRREWPRWGATLLDLATHLQGTAAVGFNTLDGSDERFQPQWYTERCRCLDATAYTADRLMPAWLEYKEDEQRRLARDITEPPPVVEVSACDDASEKQVLRAKGERVYRIATAVLADRVRIPSSQAPYTTAQVMREQAWREDWIPFIAAAAVTEYDNILDITMAEQAAAIAWLRNALQRVMAVFLMDPRTWPSDRTSAVTLALMPPAIADIVRAKYSFEADSDRPPARMLSEARGCRRALHRGGIGAKADGASPRRCCADGNAGAMAISAAAPRVLPQHREAPAAQRRAPVPGSAGHPLDVTEPTLMPPDDLVVLLLADVVARGTGERLTLQATRNEVNDVVPARIGVVALVLNVVHFQLDCPWKALCFHTPGNRCGNRRRRPFAERVKVLDGVGCL